MQDYTTLASLRVHQLREQATNPIILKRTRELLTQDSNPHARLVRIANRLKQEFLISGLLAFAYVKKEIS